MSDESSEESVTTRGLKSTPENDSSHNRKRSIGTALVVLVGVFVFVLGGFLSLMFIGRYILDFADYPLFITVVNDLDSPVEVVATRNIGGIWATRSPSGRFFTITSIDPRSSTTLLLEVGGIPEIALKISHDTRYREYHYVRHTLDPTDTVIVSSLPESPPTSVLDRRIFVMQLVLPGLFLCLGLFALPQILGRMDEFWRFTYRVGFWISAISSIGLLYDVARIAYF